MRLWPSSWGYPHALVIGLVVVLVGSVLLAGATSAAAFGSYNPSWDGASQLRDVTAGAGTEATILTNTSEYRDVDPNGTVAVVLSPDSQYTGSERTMLRSFVRNGGTLVVAEDYGAIGNSVLAATGASVRIDGRPLRDERRYYRGPALAVAPSTADHPLTTDVEQLTLNHGSVLVPSQATGAPTVAASNATVLVNSSEFSYLDTNGNGRPDDSESLRSFPIVAVEPVGEGQVIAVADPSVFINAMLERPGNEQFASNIAAAHDRVLLDYSHTAGQPPLITILLTLRKSAVMTTVVAVLLLCGIGLWVRWPALDLLGSRTLGRGSTTAAGQQPVTTDDSSALVAYLRDQHPEWSERRLRRLMTAVFTQQPEDSDDE